MCDIVTSTNSGAVRCSSLAYLGFYRYFGNDCNLFQVAYHSRDAAKHRHK
jgi:hypothetical protein